MKTIKSSLLEQKLCLKKMPPLAVAFILEILFYPSASLTQHLQSLKDSQQVFNGHKWGVLSIHWQQHLSTYNPDPERTAMI